VALVHPTLNEITCAQADYPAEIQALLHEFGVVFHEQSTPPPSREYDHAIALQSRRCPRPYRYFFLTETTAGLSQSKQYIQSSLSTRLYSLYKIGSTKPEYTGVTREEKKK
jgi:hypothetical protein